MQTRKKDFSILGFGCMRFPKRGGRIDPYATEHLIVHAIEYGINYFDTAYIYNGSEAILGDILNKNHLREKIHIATKMPHYLIKNMEDFESLFRTQLRRLQTDYIDNYLMHMLPDIDIWHKLEEKGIRKWIADKKEAGQIAISVFLSTEIRRHSANCSMPTRGTSASASTITWMNIRRPAEKGCSMLPSSAFPS
jgi:predicted aldo/keto reductase-like oxidoreductase